MQREEERRLIGIFTVVPNSRALAALLYNCISGCEKKLHPIALNSSLNSTHHYTSRFYRCPRYLQWHMHNQNTNAPF